VLGSRPKVSCTRGQLIMLPWLWGASRTACAAVFFLATTAIFGVQVTHAETLQLSVNGQARTALVERPTEQSPRPTIIMLHEADGTAAGIAHSSGLGRIAPRRGFAAVFPQGLAGSRWNFYPPGKETPGFLEMSRRVGGVPDDVAFLKTIVADLVRRRISDPKRIYISGTSNGGFMALRMICVDAEMFAALGLLISGMPDVVAAACNATRAIPVLMVKGTADPIVPHAGGLVANVLPVWPTERLVTFFLRLDGCSGPAEQAILPGQHPQKIEIDQWMKCAGASVVLYRIVGGGHFLPPTIQVGEVLLDFLQDKVR
jgi:polyhydroxybutyrate depolymerase